jgi:flagellar assembly protein FliH
MNNFYKSPPLNSEVVIDTKSFAGLGEGRSLIERLENKIRVDEARLKRLEEEIRKKSSELSHIEEYVRREAEKKQEQKIREAEERAASIIEEAEKKAEEIRNGAYTEGFSEGRADGNRKGEIEAQRLVASLQSLISALSQTYEEATKKADIVIAVELATLIAKKIVKDEVASKKEVILSNLKEAIKKVIDQEKITLIVNLSDLEAVSGWRERFLKSAAGIRRIDIREDPSIEPGGCKIQTSFGIIDATISTQLNKIKEEIIEYESKRD